MLPPWVDGLYKAFSKLEAKVTALATRLEGLDEECTALRDCLDAQGLLPCDRLHARLHRRRFAGMVRAHPAHWQVTFSALHASPELTLALLAPAGLACVQPLAATSRGMWRTLHAASHSLCKAFPPRLFAIGGFGREGITNSVDCLNTSYGAEGPCASSSWTPIEQLPSARASGAAVALRGRIYLLGGCSEDGNATDAVMQLEVSGGSWSAGPPMLEARKGVAATTCGGLVYALGGFTSREYLSSAERLDPQTLAWEMLPPMAGARAGGSAAAGSTKAEGARIFAVGGRCKEGVLNAAECFDPDKDVWTPLPKLDRARCGTAAAVVTMDAQMVVCVFGGYDGAELLACAEQIRSPWQAWTSLAPLPEPTAFAGYASCGGAVFVVGGCDKDWNAVDSVDCYSPATDTWTRLPSLPSARRTLGVAASRG